MNETWESYIARIMHEINRAYCQMIGDFSQPPWCEAPDWQRESSVHSVQNILDDPSLTPELSHEKWLTEKLAQGWVYGEVKDAEKKTHPCIRPFGELSEEQRIKDTIFGAAVRGLIASIPKY